MLCVKRNIEFGGVKQLKYFCYACYVYLIVKLSQTKMDTLIDSITFINTIWNHFRQHSVPIQYL